MTPPLIGWKAASANRDVASIRFRVEAPLAALRARGHDVELFNAEHLRDYAAVVFVKSYTDADAVLAAELREAGARVAFDLCDNHFYNPGHLTRYARAREQMLRMIARSQVVTCSTDALAAVVQAEAELSSAPHVVGDIAERSAAAPTTPPSERCGIINLLWFGSHGSPNAPGGMEDLVLIRRHLERFASAADVRLTVVSNNREKFDSLVAPFELPTCYVEWSGDAQTAALSKADAVLIPISINPFTQCKTHNRLTTALYAGVPALATRIEAYAEFAPFCSLDDWHEGLQRLRRAPRQERARARASRAYIDRHWSPSAIAPLWERVLGLPSHPQKRRMYQLPWTRL